MKIQDIVIKETPIIGAYHIQNVLSNSGIKKVIEWIKQNVYLSKFDSFVGTGVSGTIIVPILAREFNKRFLIVRKPGRTHSYYKVEGKINNRDRWVFVDDLIDTGKTFNRVQKIINDELHAFNPSYVGNILYTHKFVSPSIRRRNQNN